MEKSPVELLKTLLEITVHNTKQDIDGKATNPAKERKSITNLLKVLLGRTPTEQEIDDAAAY